MCKKTIIFAAIAFMCYSCCNTNEPYMFKDAPKHVILVGFDGMSGNAIRNGANMPNLRKLMAEGAYTTECRSILPSSSACNWASMFMGAGPELHGYNTWGSQKPDLPSRVVTETGIFPNIFSEYRRAYPDAEIGYIYEWSGMKYVADTLAMNLNINIEPTADNPRGCTDKVVEYIKSKTPDMLVVAFAEPDGVGHGIGWGTKEYMDKLTQLDGYLGEIIQAVNDAGIADETLLIVSADHGGIGTGHGGITMQEMQTPVVFWGKNVKKGYELKNSMMIFDIASTILDVKQTPQPQVWIGRPVVEAFAIEK